MMNTSDTELPSGSVPWDALARYFAGEMPARDVAEMRQWIDASPERRDQVERLRAAWGVAGDLRGQWDTEAALARMLPAEAPESHIVRLSRNGVPAEGGRSAWGRAGMWAAAAAVVAIAVAGAWRAGVLASRSIVETASAQSEVATPRGQRASLRLPDGTRVMLGPESKLRYAVAYARGPRTVQLEGEAYFEVTHDAARPFTVRTAKAVATDLGTRFTVSAYAHDTSVTVAVVDGEVSLRPTGGTAARDSVFLTPGDLGRVTANGVQAERDVALDRYVDWTTGRLVFQDTPLKEAAERLGRWYNLDVRVQGSSLGAKRVTARFKNESATQAVALIAASLDLQVDATDSLVVLRAR